MQRAVFAKAFPVITSLNTVQHAEGAEVGGINQFTILIKIKAPGIAAAFAKQFKLARQRMVAPDALLKFDPANVRSHRAALATVEPAIRSPGQ